MVDYLNKIVGSSASYVGTGVSYIGSGVSSVGSGIGRIFKRSSTTAPIEPPKPQVIKEYVPTIQKIGYEHLPRLSKNLLRLAGFSGCLAVCLSAYGSHFFKRREASYDLRELFNTAQYYHMVHSVALLALPLVKRPIIVI